MQHVLVEFCCIASPFPCLLRPVPVLVFRHSKLIEQYEVFTAICITDEAARRRNEGGLGGAVPPQVVLTGRE